MRDFALELSALYRSISEDVEQMEKRSKEISDTLYNVQSKTKYYKDEYYKDDDCSDEADEIIEIKQLIRKYNNTKFIEIGYDIQHDSWFMTAMTTDGEKIIFNGFPKKEYALIDLKKRNFKQIDEAIEKIISIGTITIGLDNYVEPCYDMYKAIEILIKERDNILHNKNRKNPAKRVSACKLPIAYK